MDAFVPGDTAALELVLAEVREPVGSIHERQSFLLCNAKFLGKKEPVPVTISSRARDIADELDLPDNAAMLEFLSEAEILLEADGNDPEQTYDLMFQAGWEFATLMVEAGARRQIQ